MRRLGRSATPVTIQHLGICMISAANMLVCTEGSYCARLICASDTSEASLFQRLRYDYFVHEKSWVPADPDNPRLETDCYDAFAHHLAVFREQKLVAYLRLLDGQAPCGLMLDHEFRCLLPTNSLPLIHDGSVELSRLVLAPRAVLPLRDTRHAVELLFKLFYQLSRQHDWRHAYIVVEPTWLKSFQRQFSFAFEQIGPVHLFPGGTQAVAAGASIADLEDALLQRNPAKLAWYQGVESSTGRTGWGAGQGERERAALAKDAPDLNAPAHSLQNGAGDVEAKPGALNT